ncbi:MAG: hypothetical protein IJT65_07820 [Eubacterium sp.]|nr:hypothetical protein [Eubacterium sp.]
MKPTKKLISLLISLIMLIGIITGACFVTHAEGLPSLGANNYVSLTLGEDIVTNYYIDYNTYKSLGASALRYTYNEYTDLNGYNEKTVNVDFDGLSDDYFEISIPQSAVQMAEPCVIEILDDGENIIDTINYSAAKYCQSVISMESSEVHTELSYKSDYLKNLCKCILTYGKYAQAYFSSYMISNSDNTVEITDDYYNELGVDSCSATSSVVKNNSELISFKSMSFIFTSSAKLRIYYDVDDESSPLLEAQPVVSNEHTFEKGYTYKKGKKAYYIDITGIKPVEFTESITLSYGGASITVRILDYASSIIASSSNTAMVKLAKTLIKYNSCSEDYFNTELAHGAYYPAVSASCTQPGNTPYYYCSVCDKYFTDAACENETTLEAVTLAALGHDYNSVVTAPTCTEAGYTTHTCSRCQDTYTDSNVNALGHDFSSVVTAPTCTEAGYTTHTCSRCQDTYTDSNVNALGHDYSSVVTAPTCTEAGYTTYTCSRCGDTYVSDYTNALGHTPAPAVEENRVEATCTLAGSYDSVVYCSVCGEEISRASQTIPATGHTEGDSWSVKTPATLDSDGQEVKTCTVCNSETSARTIKKFTLKLPNTDSYLYRVGSSNTVTLGTFFDSESGADITNVTATVTNKAGSATGTFTANSSDWREGTLKFNNTGVVTLTLKHGNNTAATLYLEVVSGTNKVSGALGNISSNTVLLGDVTANRNTVSNKAVIYGNGFTITDVRTNTSGANGAYITMSGGATINNAVLMGKIYSTLVTDGTSNQEYAPGVWITGDANIYNSYVSEAKNALEIKEGTVNLINSTFSGGALSNIEIQKGETTLENCTTQTSDRGGLKGLGIRVSGIDAKLNIINSFNQYNWLSQNDIPSTYSSVLSSIYNDSNYTFTNNNTKYVNMGIFFMSGASNISSSTAQSMVNDNTGNNYGYVEKSYLGYTGTLYTAKSSMGSAAMLTSPAYSPRTNGQYYVLPNEVFDFTNKNYIPKTAGDNNYCYYDTGTKSVQISFDKENASSAFSWDPMILSVTKNANTISDYTVKYKKVGETAYTNTTSSNISFDETADYEVVYTYTDPYNYDKDGNAFNHTYEKTLNVSVSAVEPDQTTYYASFAYTGAAGTYNAKQVIGTDNKTYVMPDVSQTSSTIGSTTVGGKTVYYPIVTVPATSSNGNSAYSSGKGYYFAPVFSELNITDYNQDTGAALYTYDKSSSTWPHGKGSSNGPDSAIFGYANGAAFANQPYGRSMGTTYYGYGKNNNGLCYTSKEIEKDNSASSHLVQYHYVSNDGTTYYFYIQYAFGAMTYSSCVAEGSLVTMADGTQKPIEDVKQGDMVMTWSMWNGRYEAQPVALTYYHGSKEWEVLTLTFSDGTEVRTINQHGFFDKDKNTYAYITPSNVSDYIGDRFVKQLPDASNTEVTLESYTVTKETVGCYSLQTAFNENFMVENMLSITGEDYEGRFEYFDIGEDMKYDEAKMQADIDKYGLYTYEEWSDYLTPEQFAAFNGRYFKVLVGKGVFTYEDILGIIKNNL